MNKTPEELAQDWVAKHSFVKRYCADRSTHKYGRNAFLAGYQAALAESEVRERAAWAAAMNRLDCGVIETFDDYKKQ